MKFDKVMDEIGFGMWQIKNCLLAFPILMWAGLTTLFQTFAGKKEKLYQTEMLFLMGFIWVTIHFRPFSSKI